MTSNAVFDVLENGYKHLQDKVRGKEGLTSGNSSQSDMLSAGKMMVLAPALRAATVFSRKPPMRRTLPVTVNSPVMAIVGSKGLSKANDKRELAMVIPADGPIDRQPTILEESEHNTPLTIFLDSPLWAVKMHLGFLKEFISRE